MGSVSLKVGEGTARFKKSTLCSSALNLIMLFSVLTTNLFALYAFKYSGSKPHHPNHSHKKHHQSLPLGKDSRSGLTEMVSSVGHTCLKSRDLLSDYMNYKVDDVCPDDWMGISSFPSSLWKQVSDKIVTWSGLLCRSFKCLNSKKIAGNCNGCFDLVNGTERNRFVRVRGKNDFLIDDVLGLVGNGGIRLGFDIGGGSGTFAARMAEKEVTVITSTLNVDAPFNDFIAARGLFPLYSSLDQDFTWWFVWLDNFYCVDEERKINLTKLIEKFGYKKLKWVIGERSDGSGRSQVYLSAILQKTS
ncbi:hypothetical protein MKW92_044103 [Papaver armeniacum]|nr:hypothetical protein MKW92_044103 [Papaver armeniacum]